MKQISVIVPIYNGEKYVESCIDSFSKQYFKDFEVIFVDDGSKDCTVKKIEEYASQAKLNFSLISQPNGGVSTARNAGVDIACGEYICFVDVDDILAPEFLQEMYEKIITYALDICICCDGTKLYEGTKKFEIYSNFEALKKYLFRELSCGACTILIKRGLIDKHNIRFANELKYSEDIHFVWRILAVSSKIGFIDTVLYEYKKNAGSAMSKFNENRFGAFSAFADLNDWFYSYCKEFVKIFKKYGLARWLWSLSWQCAVIATKTEYLYYMKKYGIRKYMKKLIWFPKWKIRLSAFIFCISKNLFRHLSKMGAKKLPKAE